MEEIDKKQETMEQSEPEEIKRIKLTRHLWPDEIEQIKNKKTIKRLRISLVILGVAGLLVGWVFGSFVPIPGAKSPSTNITTIVPMNADKKIENVLDIMENSWFFAKDIDDLDTRLVDQALTGITSNEEDPHTSYMSKEEMDSFTQSINRNFVGIGVQYISVNDANIITSVFKESPAEKAGVRAGDVIVEVDGTAIAGMDSSEIKNRVTGEAGTNVVITVERQGERKDITITRAEVLATVNGEILEDGTGYLEMAQFGDSSATEIDRYLEEFDQNDVTNLIIDLRGNGGGYLTSLRDVGGRFLPKGTLIIKEEDNVGNIVETKSKGTNYHEFDQIIILISNDTASAAEAFTIAMMEQRDNVTVVGTQSYGKGTVQTNKYFEDGSALKVTYSRWLSPNDVWINQVGITPDIEADYDPALSVRWYGMEDEESYQVDSVSDALAAVQNGLRYLGYEIDRTDGYFSDATEAVLKQFQSDHDLEADGILDEHTYLAVYSAVIYDLNFVKEKDVQLQKALEVIHG